MLFFNFKIIYRQGKNNLNADVPSRYPVLEYFKNEEIIKVANLVQLEDIVKDRNNSLKKYLHILTDRFTNFVEFDIWNTNYKIFHKFNKKKLKIKQKLIYRYQYSEIKSKELQKYLESKVIKFFYTAVNHTSSNGAVEILGQTLVYRIRCKFKDNNF